MKQFLILLTVIMLSACSTSDDTEEQRLLPVSFSVPVDQYTLVVETGPFQPSTTVRAAVKIEFETGHIQFIEAEYVESELSFIIETNVGPVTAIEMVLYIEMAEDNAYIYLYNSEGTLIDSSYVDYEVESFYAFYDF